MSVITYILNFSNINKICLFLNNTRTWLHIISFPTDALLLSHDLMPIILIHYDIIIGHASKQRTDSERSI